MDWALLGKQVIESLIFSVIGIAVLLFGYWVLGKVVPFDLNKELSEDDNPAVGVFVAGMFIALGLVIAAAIT